MQIAQLFVRINGDVSGLRKSMSEAQRALDRFGKNMERVGGALTRSLTLPIAAFGAAAGKAAIDFESSFAGIRKTMDLTEAEFSRLADANRQLAKEIPVAVDELNRIGELAGQLGIRGVENVLKFEETIAKLAVTTDLTADAAAMSFAQIANVMQVPQSEIDRMGASLVGLGNNFAATESTITEFTQRIAGAGQIAGLTVADVMGIGTAFASLGINAEAGGTAVQKVLIAMVEATTQGGESLHAFAETAGMSSAQFQQAFSDDAAGAFAAFVEGLGRQGDRAIGTLDRLGLADQRLIRAFLGAAGAGDILSRAIRQANTDFAENTALTDEANQRFETAASQLRLLWNRLRDVGITLGGVMVPALMDALSAMEPLFRMVESLARGFEGLSPRMQTFIVALAGISAALGPVLIVLGKLVAILPALQVALGGLLGPIGLVTAALAVGGAAWIAWRRNVEDSAAGAKAAIDGVAESLATLSREQLIAATADNLRRIEGLKAMPQTEFIRGEIAKLEAQTQQLVGRFNEMQEAVRETRAPSFDTSGVTEPLEEVAEAADAAIDALERLDRIVGYRPRESEMGLADPSIATLGGLRGVGGLDLTPVTARGEKPTESLAQEIANVALAREAEREAIQNIGVAIRSLSKSAARGVQGVQAFAASVDLFRKGQGGSGLAGVLNVAGGLIGGISAITQIGGSLLDLGKQIFGQSQATRELIAVMKSNTDRLRELKLAQSGFKVGQDQVDLAAKVSAEIRQAFLDNPITAIAKVGEILQRNGLTMDQFVAIVESTGIQIRDATGKILLPAVAGAAEYLDLFQVSLEKTVSSMTNVPTVFANALRRFQASTAGIGGTGTVGTRPPLPGVPDPIGRDRPTLEISGPVTVVANDPAEFARQMESYGQKVLMRGGYSHFALQGG